MTASLAPTRTQHTLGPSPIHISVTNHHRAFTPGDAISGRVSVSLQRELIDSIEIRLFGVCETEIPHAKLGFSSTSSYQRIYLIDVVKSVVSTPFIASNESWPFQFIVPEFTDTPGEYGSVKTPRKFAIRRHRLPPSFLQRDAAGNKAHISYGVQVRILRDSRKLEPYVSWHEVKLDVFQGQQAVPEANKHDLKMVVKHMGQKVTLSQTIRHILRTGRIPSLRIAPSISLPDQIVPGGELPFTILLDPKPKGPADPSGSEVTLVNLKIDIKETTTILCGTRRTFRYSKYRQVDLAHRQFAIENRRVETSRPSILPQETTQSMFKRSFVVDKSLNSDIQSFTAATSHDISIWAELACDDHKFNLKLVAPVAVVRRRSFDLDLGMEPDINSSLSGMSSPSMSARSTSSTHTSTSGCPSCRRKAARRASRALLPPAKLNRIMEWSQLSLETDQAPDQEPSAPATLLSMPTRNMTPRSSMESLSTIRQSRSNESRDTLLTLSDSARMLRVSRLPQRSQSLGATPLRRRTSSTP